VIFHLEEVLPDDFLKVPHSCRNKRFELMGRVNDPHPAAADKPDQAASRSHAGTCENSSHNSSVLIGKLKRLAA
jgi:hypothetical protein